MKIIGVLPASGKASRIGGIPKFCLPVDENKSIIEWHVSQMSEVCDEVRVSTRPEWVPIIQSMNLNVKLMVREPTTMSDAIKFMVGDYTGTVIVGMPDTYMIKSENNIYNSLIQNKDSDLVVGAWKCSEDLKGRVGQIEISEDRVILSKDKQYDCDYEYMWGTLLFRKNMIRYIDKTSNHPGEQIQGWIDEGFNIKAVKMSGEYMDIGTFKGLKDLYRKMEN
jgi:GTP:adenosylcobinamide-phosphate guanylyltransferase